jgi:GT2 family glycosyltransferase
VIAPSSSRIAVVILTYDQREMTLACLESLRGVTAPPHRVVLWDNASSDGTVEAVADRFPEVIVHWSPENLGVAGGRNAAAALAMERLSPEYLMFLDNDMEVTPGFLEALVTPMDEDPRIGQTQAKLRFMEDRERLNDGGGCRITWWRGETRPVGYRELDRGQRDVLRPCVACGGAMMVRSGVFRSLGGFDLAFNPFGPEDLDFSLRLQDAGYQALYVPQAVLYHAVSHSFDGGAYSRGYARLKARHWVTFMRRHAPWHQRMAFYLLGVPFLATRMVIREGRRGNLGALLGTLSAGVDLLPGGRRRTACSAGEHVPASPPGGSDPSPGTHDAHPPHR